MIKNVLISLTLTIFSFFLQAQSITETKLVGTWKVNAINTKLQNNLSSEQVEILDELKFKFNESTFHFNANKTFEWVIEISDLKKMTENSIWRLNSSYIVEIIKTKDLIMEITIKFKNGKYYAIITEMPFVLEIEKI
jgi:hypothetical protein